MTIFASPFYVGPDLMILDIIDTLRACGAKNYYIIAKAPYDHGPKTYRIVIYMPNDAAVRRIISAELLYLHTETYPLHIQYSDKSYVYQKIIAIHSCKK